MIKISKPQGLIRCGQLEIFFFWRFQVVQSWLVAMMKIRLAFRQHFRRSGSKAPRVLCWRNYSASTSLSILRTTWRSLLAAWLDGVVKSCFDVVNHSHYIQQVELVEQLIITSSAQFCCSWTSLEELIILLASFDIYNMYCTRRIGIHSTPLMQLH